MLVDNRDNQAESNSNSAPRASSPTQADSRKTKTEIRKQNAMQAALLAQVPSHQKAEKTASSAESQDLGQDVSASAPRASFSKDRIPARLRAKLDRAEAGDSRNQRLNKYRDEACRLVKENVQPEESMTLLDMENLDKLIETENDRHHGLLNLRRYGNPGYLIDDLSDMKDGTSFRALTRLYENALHHVMISANKAPGKKPTVIILESSEIWHDDFLGWYRSFIDRSKKKKGLDISRFGLIHIGAQGSPNDCVMYGLNFALKSLEHEKIFEEMHGNLDNGLGLKPDIDLDTHFKNSGEWLRKDGRIKQLGEMKHASGALTLPPAFFKHTNSATVAREVSKVAADSASPGQPPATDRVNSARHANPESLTERVEAFRVTRPIPESDEYSSYGASIEGFRLQEISRTRDRTAVETT